MSQDVAPRNSQQDDDQRGGVCLPRQSENTKDSVSPLGFVTWSYEEAKGCLDSEDRGKGEGT